MSGECVSDGGEDIGEDCMSAFATRGGVRGLIMRRGRVSAWREFKTG